MSVEELKYFFSYTRNDSEFVLKLAKDLRAVGANVWLDQLDILGGQHWDRTVEQALKSCKGMIAVLSPESVASDNVMDEVSYALDEGKLVVPILIRSCDIPFRLRRVQYIDFTDDYDTGFSQLLRALHIEQPTQRLESTVTQEPVVQEQSLSKQSESTIGEQKPADAIQTRRKGTPKNDRPMDTIIQKRIKKSAPSFRSPFELDAEYILIPGGRYKYQGKREKKVPNVYFAKYPVTNKRYRRFIRYLEGKEGELFRIPSKDKFDKAMVKCASAIRDFGEYLASNPKNWPEKLRSRYDSEKRFNGDDQPVVGVSWFAARAYCFWLSALEEAGRDSASGGGLYRLPTELEWEWAAGGGKREYPWAPEKGSPTDKLANYDRNVEATTPVGRYPEGATPEGLMDMAGNVWEWMENWHEKYEGEYRSLRGGSWDGSEGVLRCSERNYIYPDDCFYFVGFRVVRSQS